MTKTELALVQTSFFEEGTTAHARRPLDISIFTAAKKRRFARPTKLSRIPRNTDIAEAVKGSELLGLPLTRQGEEVAAVCQALNKQGHPLYRDVVVLIPRRSAKTTSVWATILGRCYNRPDYKVATTAQDGIRARARFREVLRALDKLDFEGEENPMNRLGRLRWANGDESIEFDNGSRIWVVPPDPAAFRGEAADLIFFDECGEYSPEKSEDLAAGALPLMDTRQDGQVIYAGTPRQRTGLFWDKFKAATAPKSKLGIVAYYIEDHEQAFTVNEEGENELNTQLLRRTHPGIGTLSTFDIIASRAQSMPFVKFEAEYLCRFPFDNTSSAISRTKWESCASPTGLPPRPERIAVAFDCAPDGSTGAVVAAWRDDGGRAHLEVLGSEWGTDWIPGLLRKVALKYRIPIAFDSIGATADVADRVKRLGVRVSPFYPKDMMGAAQRIVQAVNLGQLVHYEQADLTTAATGAAWRPLGETGRLFSRKIDGGDVSPLVAASAAIWQFDRQAKNTITKIITSEEV